MDKTVLLIGNSRTFAMFMAILVKRMGFGLIYANNGPEAVELIEAIHPDAVIIDSELTVFDGLDKLERINEGGASIPPVILLVGAHAEEAEARCINVGASTVVSKPVQAEELHQALQECMFIDFGLRRRYVRTKTELSATVYYMGAELALTVDSLSAGGAYFRHDQPLDVGTIVDVLMPLGEKVQLSVSGKVIYNEKPCRNSTGICPGFAVKFLDMDAKNTDSLREYILGLLTNDITELLEVGSPAADSYSTIHTYAGRPSIPGKGMT